MNEKENPKIKDIAKFKKMSEDLRGFKIMKMVLPFASPFLNLIGVNTKDMKEAFKDFDKLEKEFLELSELPDKFNNTFSSRGWIMYDHLNLEVAKAALELAKTDMNAAEQHLTDYYTPETVEMFLMMMQGVKAFRPRMELAEKAFIDYKEERYHACIPVILALMDGLVNELNKQQSRGFFSENSDLRAWDCITAHEKGLNALKEIFQKGRYKTTTDEITIPYRNGILHGMDLGYANKIVAVKTWAALFAVRDWAIKAENKMLSEPPPKPQPTWVDIFQRMKEHQDWKSKWEVLFANWKPRNIICGKDIPKNGEISDYETGTPESKVVEFLTYWKKKNYGYMAKCLESSFSVEVKKLAQKVRENYQHAQLIAFELVEVKDEAPAISEVDISLTYEQSGQVLNKIVVCRLLIYDKKNNPTIFGDPNADWFIMNWYFV